MSEEPLDESDREIMFFLQLLLNEYAADDIARVAVDLASIFDEQFECQDCKENVLDKHEFFLVHDELDVQVGLNDGRLCVACYEARLGRELCFFDFTNAMVIQGEVEHSPLLKQRLINGLEETLPKEQ